MVEEISQKQIKSAVLNPLAASLHNHRYPSILLRWPRCIHLLYCWNNLVLQRNWTTRRALRQLLPTLPDGTHILDAGCGEGLHLLPWAGRFPKLQFTGVDRLENNLEFVRRYVAVSRLQNVDFQKAKLENYIAKEKAGLLLCIGILQYIAKDERVLENIHNSLNDNGLSVFYIPINGRVVLPYYRYFFSAKMHYERSQNRVRIYGEHEFFSKLKMAGFEILERKYTYGKLGILGHEIYTLLILGMGNARWAGWVFAILLPLFLPLILGLKWVDFLQKKETGNGLLVVVSKGKKTEP